MMRLKDILMKIHKLKLNNSLRKHNLMRMNLGAGNIEK